MRIRRPRVDWFARAQDLAVDLREVERLEQKRDPDAHFESLDRWEQAMTLEARR